MAGTDLTSARGWLIPDGDKLPHKSWSYDACMPDETEYLCTHNAHDPETLTRHMNHMAGQGWELLTVDFAIRGETGFHTFFWRRPLRVAQPSQPG
jgi:hypothetical protein